MVPLTDMLKEAVLRTGCLQGVTTVTSRRQLATEVLAERLMLAIYAYCTKAGIRAVAEATVSAGGAAGTAAARKRSGTCGASTSLPSLSGVVDGTYRSTP
ncbi:hypothetical protein [Actinomadura nitritigenes]|uniref:hypothetical protein n=1 Tax=Actinomadura nitritigenes TaxID=134602 RepID=UPI003D8E5289